MWSNGAAVTKGTTKWAKARYKQYNVEALFDSIAVDVVGPFHAIVDNNTYIFVAMDYFSK